MAVGTFVALDLYALDGRYLHAAQTIVLTMRQHYLGW
jgi:hypothetical protein